MDTAPSWKKALQAAREAPLCDAWARSAGRECRNKAMRNGKCRFHGGKNPGAPLGNVNALVYGGRTLEAGVERKARKDLGKSVRMVTEIVMKAWKGRIPAGVAREAIRRLREMRAYSEALHDVARERRQEKLNRKGRGE